MSRKKKNPPSGFGREFRSLFFGWFLLFVAAIVFLGESSSLVGGVIEGGLRSLLGEFYKAFFVPIVALVALGIIF